MICNKSDCFSCNKPDCVWNMKHLTNADRIRAMSIEEIENWFWWMHKEMMRYTDSRVFLHEWLRQEAEEGER